MFYGVLSRRLRVLPPGLSMVLRIFLSRCRLHPPPNCDPHVYSLMGKFVLLPIYIVCITEVKNTNIYMIKCSFQLF